MEETTVKALFALYLIIGLLTAEGIVVRNEGLKEMLDDEYGRVILFIMTFISLPFVIFAVLIVGAMIGIW